MVSVAPALDMSLRVKEIGDSGGEDAGDIVGDRVRRIVRDLVMRSAVPPDGLNDLGNLGDEGRLMVSVPPALDMSLRVKVKELGDSGGEVAGEIVGHRVWRIVRELLLIL
jgi:hypothetical protein